jgi:hypothetical protein
MNLRSKFHLWKVYVVLTFSVLALSSMGYFLITVARPKPGDSKELLILAGILSLFLAIYLMYIYIKNLPIIYMDHQGVILRTLLSKQTFSWLAIESVIYSGKNSFRMAFGYQAETMVIRLKDNDIIKIFYEHYANSHLIQQYIRSYHEQQQPPIFAEEIRVSPDEIYGESFISYKGTPLLSFRGITIWGFILFMLFIVIKDGNSNKISVFVSICLIWYAAHSYFCYYIELSDNYLVIKNYFIPFVGKKYRLSDIRELAVETYPKWPNCLRVITNSFRYKIFPCGPIPKKEWELFMEAIQERGILVRNEAI